MAVILSSPCPTRGLFGQTKLLNITTGNESFLVKGSLGAPLTSIFCWKGKPATLGRFWESLLIEIVVEQEDYKVHLDRNVEVVEEAATIDSVFWFHSSANQVLGDTFYISPFKESCIAVTTSETFHLISHLVNIDTRLLIMSLIGLALYANSRQLARLKPVSLISSHLLNMVFPWGLNLPLLLQPIVLACGLYVLFTLFKTGASFSPLSWGRFNYCLHFLFLSMIFAGYYSVSLAVSILTAGRRSSNSVVIFLKISGLALVWRSSYNEVCSSLVAASLFALSSPFSSGSTGSRRPPAPPPDNITAVALQDLRR